MHNENKFLLNNVKKNRMTDYALVGKLLLLLLMFCIFVSVGSIVFGSTWNLSLRASQTSGFVVQTFRPIQMSCGERIVCVSPRG